MSIRRGHILIAVPPLTGHVIPSLGLGRALVGAGHRVTYVTTEKYLHNVKSIGADLAATTIAYDGLSAGLGEDAKNAQFNAVIRAGTLEIQTDLPRLLSRLEADPPDVVCTNYVSQIGYALADRLQAPNITLYPTYAWSESVHNRVYGASTPNEAMVAAIEERVAVADRWGVSVPRYLPFGGPLQQNLVSIPKSFQIEAQHFGDRYQFIGPDVSAHPGRALWQPRFPGRPLLYISFGTTYNENVGFYQKAFEAFAGSDFQVALSVGDKIALDDLGDIPHNFEVRRSFPQISVLAHADVFITHAGTGSVMEALLSEVPMLAFPQQGDQVLYAQTLHRLGLGVDYSAVEDPGLQGLCAAAERLSADLSVRRNLEQLHQELVDGGGTAAGVRVIESMMAARCDE